MFGSEMRVAHNYLQRFVPEQLCHRAQINPGHNQSTGKGMPLAMPGIPSISVSASAVENQPRDP
jgi:hypothetical protein